MTRHFVEVFIWRPARRPGHRTLQWQLHELTGERFEVKGGADVGEESGEPWSNGAIRPEWTAVALQRKSDDDLQWSFEHLELSDTIPALDIELVPEAAHKAPQLPATGSERLEVAVFDASGSVISGADVHLKGVVERLERMQNPRAGRSDQPGRSRGAVRQPESRRGVERPLC